MKAYLIFLVVSSLGCLGCLGSRPAPARYTVGLDDVLEAPLALPATSNLKVTLAPDLQTMTAPFVYHSDGRVTTYSKLTYYAVLPIVLERTIEDHLCVKPQVSSSRLQLMIVDYCLDLRNETPMVVVRFKANLVQTPTGLEVSNQGEPLLELKGTCALAEDYTVQDVRKAFAIALMKALTPTS